MNYSLLDPGQKFEEPIKIEKSKEEKEAILNKIFVKVASKTATNGFYKPNANNNFFEDNKKSDDEFDRYFKQLGKRNSDNQKSNNVRSKEILQEKRQQRQINYNTNEANDAKYTNNYANYEFRTKIAREKERIKKDSINKEIKNLALKNKTGLSDKEVLIFNESFNNISLIEQLENLEKLDDIDVEVAKKKEIESEDKLKSLKQTKGIVKSLESEREIENKRNKHILYNIDIDSDNEDDINVNDMNIDNDFDFGIPPKFDESENKNNQNFKHNIEFLFSNNLDFDDYKNEEEYDSNNQNMVSNKPAFSKSGANFFSNINTNFKNENVNDLLKRVMEKKFAPDLLNAGLLLTIF